MKNKNPKSLYPVHPVKMVVSGVLICLFLTDCCTTKTVLSANGDVKTGVMGGTVAVKACTTMEKEVANQLAQLSDWYRTQWDSCGTNSDAAACRVELSKGYQEQQKLLLDV